MKNTFTLLYAYIIKKSIVKVTFIIITTFTIQASAQSIIVTSPNGNEKWEANSTQTIKWESKSIKEVKIDYSLNGGLSWGVIVQSTEATLGEFSWIVADAQTPYVLIRISDASNPLIFSNSEKTFSIVKENQQLNKPAEVDNTAVRIMPLGDSITQGVLTSGPNPSDKGYRKPLDLLLTNGGYIFDFVGSLQTGEPQNFDRDHEGHPGWYALRNTDNSKSMFHQLNSLLTNNPPQIVLLHIGTNDISSGQEPRPADTIASKVKDLLDIIYSFDSTITTIIAKIIDRDDTSNGPWHQKTIDFNNALQNEVNNLSLGQSEKVILVDMFSALGNWNSTYFSDNLHPNANGYEVMANTWFDSLAIILPAPTILADIKIFLEGPYSSGSMSTSLNSILPTNDPYSLGESVGSIPNSNIVDWVLVELRNSPTTVTATRAAFIKNDGNIVDLDGISPVGFSGISPGNYYIVVRHRNHLAVMSASSIALNQYEPASAYEFSTGSNKFFGGSAGSKDLGAGVWGMISGDGTSNGSITAADNNSVWFVQFLAGEDGYKSGDYNLTGSVTASDNNLHWLINNGKDSQVP